MSLLRRAKVDMGLAWGIVVVLCLGLPALGVASRQQDASGPATTTGQAPAAGAPQTDTPTEPKKEPPAEPPQTAPPQTAPQQAVPQQTAPQQNAPTGSPAEPQTRPPPTEPRTEPPPIEPSIEPGKKAGAGAEGANVRRHAGKKRAPATDGGPQKVIVRHGGVDEPTAQIVTGLAPEEANRQRQHAEQLLRSTDETLRGADLRAFDALQEETVSQIHNYMEGAHLALKEGDISRGETLAMKAGLLADDLVRHSPAAKEK